MIHIDYAPLTSRLQDDNEELINVVEELNQKVKDGRVTLKIDDEGYLTVYAVIHIARKALDLSKLI